MSKYGSILGAREKMEPEPAADCREETPAAPAPTTRPLAKSKDPAYVQAPAYIKRTTHEDVKVLLVRERLGRDYSELVQDLLERYVEENQHHLH
jgi:hypothetical protein